MPGFSNAASVGGRHLKDRAAHEVSLQRLALGTAFPLGTGAVQHVQELPHLSKFSRGHCQGMCKARVSGSLRLTSRPFPFPREEQGKGKVTNKAHNDTNLAVGDKGEEEGAPSSSGSN